MGGLGRALAALQVLAVTVFALPVFAATSLEVGMLGSTAAPDASNRVSLGMRFGPVQPQQADAEFAVTVFAGAQESAWSDGSVLGGAGAMLDLGMARSFASGPAVALVPRLSLIAVSAVGEGGAGVAMGLSGGIGFVTLPAQGAGVRIDAGYRWLALPQDREGLWSISIGALWRSPREGAKSGGVP